MKVLFVCSGNSANGINPIIERQGNSLKEKGVSVSYFTINGKGFKGYFSAIFKLRKFLKKNDFDVLHAHYSLSGYVAILGRGHQKIVLSFMGSDLLGDNNWKKQVKLKSKIFAKINIVIAKLFFNKVIVKSPEMLKAFGVSDKTVELPNGVNLSVFSSTDLTEAKKAVRFNMDKRHVVFISNPERPEKNFALAKQAFALLDASQYELHIIFDLSTEQLISYYNAADVVLMTSLHEGSPNVIKEAMACNCPIVSTPVGDVKNLLDGVEGCYIADHDPENVKNYIIKACDYRRAKEFTNGKTRLVQLELSSEAVADKLINVYKSILV